MSEPRHARRPAVPARLSVRFPEVGAWGWVVSTALLILLAIPGIGSADPGDTNSGGPILYLRIPDATIAGWIDCDGVVGSRFVETCRAEGRILAIGDLDEREIALLDRWERETAVDLIWVGRAPGSGEGILWLGPARSRLQLRWESIDPERDTPEALAEETRIWLGGSGEFRWEEVVELLDLTRQENLAFRNLQAPGHPLDELKRTFLRDKQRTNLSLYLLGTRSPRAIGVRFDLPGRFEREVSDFARRILDTTSVPARLPAGPMAGRAGQSERIEEAGDRRFFATRVLASRARIYGRLDRTLQSLASEAGAAAVLVIDARSRDGLGGFVAIYAPAGDLQGAGIEPEIGLGLSLEGILRRNQSIRISPMETRPDDPAALAQ